MLKYGRKNLQNEIFSQFKNFIEDPKIPTEWENNIITISIVKQGPRTYLENCRKITIFDSIHKNYTGTVTITRLSNE